MNNIVRLPVSNRRCANVAPDPMVALAGIAARVAEIGQMPLHSKQDMQEALLLLDLSNVRARQLIGEIDDQESRTRLLVHSERISDLVEIARRRIAAI